MRDYPWKPDLDEATALGLALADALRGAKWAAGKTIGAEYACWAHPEDERAGTAPAVAVLPITGTFTGQMVPRVLEDTRDGDGTAVLVKDGEWTADVRLMVWATTPTMRSLALRAVREALQDRDPGARSIMGRTLDLPRYFGGNPHGRARICVERVEYEEDEQDATQGNRMAYLTVRAAMSVLRMESDLAEFEPRYEVEINPEDEPAA